MPIEVDDTAVFREGETIDYYDVGPGDTITVPSRMQTMRRDGTWTGGTTVVRSP
ncbi:MAG: hypothetical protein M5U09_18245 [Gammaproteobacteria bacterium]|nr:hypothetical protein [Gammaproteobacteria bacterium]